LCKIVPMFKAPLLSRTAISFPGAGLVTGGEGAGALVITLFVTLFCGAELILFAVYLRAVAKAKKAWGAMGGSMGILIFASIQTGLSTLAHILFYVFAKKPSVGLLNTWAIFAFVAALVYL